MRVVNIPVRKRAKFINRSCGNIWNAVLSKMRKILTLALLFAMLATPMLAQETSAETDIDTVILASTENYPDALVASAAASKEGIPVLLTEKDELPDRTREALEHIDPSNIVLVGGELVISGDVEASLSESYEVTRLSGTSRYGTANEVASYFWPEGTDSAVLVENDPEDREGHRYLAMARHLAEEDESPVLLTGEDAIPASVLSQLEDLGVSEVDYVGTDLSSEERTQLEELGITVDEEVTAPDREELLERLRERIAERQENRTMLNVVAAGEFEHSIAAAVNDVSSAAYLVTSEDEIAGAVDAVNNRGITQVRVVGRPDLARTIASRLEAETDAEVEVFGVRARAAANFSANLSDEELEELREFHRERMEAMEERLEERQEFMQERANETLQRAEEFVDRHDSPAEAEQHLVRARTHLNEGEYADSIRESHRAVAAAQREKWEEMRDNWTRIHEEHREERADMEEKIREMQEINAEFAEEMRRNMTPEERLEVIRELRDERHDRVRAIVEEARHSRGDWEKRIRQARSDVGDFHTRIRIECGDIAVGTVERLEISGHEGDVRTRGRLGLKNPGYDGSVTFDVDRNESSVQFNVVYNERDLPGTGIIQCTADSRFEARLNVPAGDWDVTTTVEVGGEVIAEESATVAVEEEEGDDDVPELLFDRLEERRQELRERLEERREEFRRELRERRDRDPEVDADDGLENGAVEVDGYIPRLGYVVVHLEEDGAPGEVVGHSRLVVGDFEAHSRVNTSSGGTAYYAMLHYDDGDGEYEFPGDDNPVHLDGEIVLDRFTVELDESGEETNSTEDTSDNETEANETDG